MGDGIVVFALLSVVLAASLCFRSFLFGKVQHNEEESEKQEEAALKFSTLRVRSCELLSLIETALKTRLDAVQDAFTCLEAQTNRPESRRLFVCRQDYLDWIHGKGRGNVRREIERRHSDVPSRPSNWGKGRHFGACVSKDGENDFQPDLLTTWRKCLWSDMQQSVSFFGRACEFLEEIDEVNELPTANEWLCANAAYGYGREVCKLWRLRILDEFDIDMTDRKTLVVPPISCMRAVWKLISQLRKRCETAYTYLSEIHDLYDPCAHETIHKKKNGCSSPSLTTRKRWDISRIIHHRATTLYVELLNFTKRTILLNDGENISCQHWCNAAAPGSELQNNIENIQKLYRVWNSDGKQGGAQFRHVKLETLTFNVLLALHKRCYHSAFVAVEELRDLLQRELRSKEVMSEVNQERLDVTIGAHDNHLSNTNIDETSDGNDPSIMPNLTVEPAWEQRSQCSIENLERSSPDGERVEKLEDFDVMIKRLEIIYGSRKHRGEGEESVVSTQPVTPMSSAQNIGTEHSQKAHARRRLPLEDQRRQDR